MEKSTVTVLHKKGRKDSIENYRPISLTCILCKVMESIISDYIMTYFFEYDLFSKFQYGFIKGRSAALQLIKVIDDLTMNLEHGKQTDILYTDFEKAFDKVSHRRLLSKLRSYGINDQVIEWIKSFLSNRSQCVKINQKLSNSRAVLSGIPQGSVLGPLLFVIYINDLPNFFNNMCDIYLFADDAKLYKCIYSKQDSDDLNKCFNSMIEWSNTWLMKLNIAKCKVLSVYTNKNNYIKYEYGQCSPSTATIALEHEDCMKDLGVLIDSELTFAKHIHAKINVAYKMLGIIRRNFNFMVMDKFTFLTLYKTLVRNHLEYVNSVWCPYKISLIRDVEKFQKHATKLFKQCKSMSYQDRLRFL